MKIGRIPNEKSQMLLMALNAYVEFMIMPGLRQ
jgi:hypothetical protein